ncbi:hypothetical protein PHLCEN_2v1109 [Hermanssonia centrifuga]|uniref:Uncharacterized protein n=1 Tax=Hermanssonia centrifuga TaxID=98765 RepID=A0A2R6S453_9APHY|nr:hypothetical protein PHLCEN_2v1109 [Hermanssonia centrifuga]
METGQQCITLVAREIPTDEPTSAVSRPKLMGKKSPRVRPLGLVGDGAQECGSSPTECSFRNVRLDNVSPE